MRSVLSLDGRMYTFQIFDFGASFDSTYYVASPIWEKGDGTEQMVEHARGRVNQPSGSCENECGSFANNRVSNPVETRNTPSKCFSGQMDFTKQTNAQARKKCLT